MTERTMFIKPELQIQKMNHVGIKIKIWRAKQAMKMYRSENKSVIRRAGAFAVYVSEDYPDM